MRKLVLFATACAIGCDAPAEAPPLAACSSSLPATSRRTDGPGGSAACAESDTPTLGAAARVPDRTSRLAMTPHSSPPGFGTVEGGGAAEWGRLCPPRRALLADQGERMGTFESFLFEKGAGVGETLRRKFYMKGLRDL